MEGSTHQFEYLESSKRYYFHQTNALNQSSIFLRVFDFSSLKTVFYKVPTSNYIQFLIDIILKKKAPCSVAGAQLMKFFTFELIHFRKQSKIEKVTASFHTE